MEAVLSKRGFYDRWRAMEFGNRVHSWDTIAEVNASGLPGPFAIRYRTPGSPWCQYHIEKEKLQEVADKFIALGANPALMEFSPMHKENRLVLQGEVQRDHRGLCLLFSTAKAPMRVALSKAGQSVFGYTATQVLSSVMDAASYMDLRELLDSYPDHVIEFSTYSVNVGIIPGRNTVIWEVRKY